MHAHFKNAIQFELPGRGELEGSNVRAPFAGVTAVLIALFGAVLFASDSVAQEQRFGRERGSIVIAGFFTERNSGARLDSSTGPGTDIQLENELGLKRTTSVLRISGGMWFKPRQRFDVSLFDMSRSASRRIDESIVFGDETFSIDTILSTTADQTIYKADYTFAFLNKQRGYLGLNSGFYVGRTSFVLRDSDLGISEGESLTAPLPVVGFRGEYSITGRLTIRAASQWFSIDAEDASGSLRDVYIGADYRFGNRFAAGLAYNDVKMNIRAEERNGWTGRLDWGYDGWLAYIRTDFGR